MLILEKKLRKIIRQEIRCLMENRVDVEGRAQKYIQGLKNAEPGVSTYMIQNTMDARQRISAFARDWASYQDEFGKHYPGWSQEDFVLYDQLLPSPNEIRSILHDKSEPWWEDQDDLDLLR